MQTSLKKVELQDISLYDKDYLTKVFGSWYAGRFVKDFNSKVKFTGLPYSMCDGAYITDLWEIVECN